MTHHLTVGEILHTKKVTGYTGNVAPDTKVCMDLGGYAVQVHGYYTLGELLAVCEDLKALNNSMEK